MPRQPHAASCSIIATAAPESNRSGSFTYANYTAQAKALSDDTSNIEWINMLELFGPYAGTDAAGLWADTSHLNDLGGRVFAGHIYNNFWRI